MTEHVDDPQSYPDFGALVGFQIHLPEPGVAVLDLQLAPHHRNRLGTVHGGVIMTLLDTAGMWACTDGGKSPVCPTVSLSCSFMKSVRLADASALQARGTVTRKGRRMVFATVTVSAGDEIVAMAQGVYAAPSP